MAISGSASIAPLDWDSQHFGFPVGRLTELTGSGTVLTKLLHDACSAGLQLVYWLAPGGVLPAAEVLEQFGGRRISGHRVYSRSLGASTDTTPPNRSGTHLASAKGEVLCDELRKLALLAGHLSRFRADERLPDGSCDRMYELWMQRSLTGELATDVIVAKDFRYGHCGFLSYQVSGDSAAIGLVSTLPEMQGKGVARALLSRAHADMAAAGVTNVVVVTQTENVAACKLYEALGYRISREGAYYHFLLPTWEA